MIALAHRVGIDHPVLVDRQVRDRRLARTLERAATVQHGLVLGDASDDVIALIFVKLDDALDCQVVGLGGAAGENDFLGLGADQRRDLFARATNGLLRLPSEAMVAAGGVAELFSEIRKHRIEHARIDPRGRMIVHVNGLFQHLFFLSIYSRSIRHSPENNSGPVRYNIRLPKRQSNGILASWNTRPTESSKADCAGESRRMSALPNGQEHHRRDYFGRGFRSIRRSSRQSLKPSRCHAVAPTQLRCRTLNVMTVMPASRNHS